MQSYLSPAMHSFIRLSRLFFFLPFEEQILNDRVLENSVLNGKSKMVADLQLLMERKTQEIVSTSQLCSGLPLPQTKQWKMFSWLLLALYLPFLFPRFANSTPISSHHLPRSSRHSSLSSPEFPRPILQHIQKIVCLDLAFLSAPNSKGGILEPIYYVPLNSFSLASVQGHRSLKSQLFHPFPQNHENYQLYLCII